MKRVLALAVVALVVGSRPAGATGFTINFCPGGAGCPANVSEARLTFDEILGTSDPNDYDLYMRIVGTTGVGTNSAYSIDEVSFTISAADNIVGVGGYEFKPTLSSAPGGTGVWSVVFDNVSASASACSSDTHNSKEVCAESAALGPLVNGTNLWHFTVDLWSGITPLAVGSQVNLRAQFLTSAGKNAGILSPNGGGLGQCTTETDCPHDVPDPGTFLMLATGLAALVSQRRRLVA